MICIFILNRAFLYTNIGDFIEKLYYGYASYFQNENTESVKTRALKSKIT